MDYQDLKSDTQVRLLEHVDGITIRVTTTPDGNVRCSSSDESVVALSNDVLKNKFLTASNAVFNVKVMQSREGVCSAVNFDVVLRDDLCIVTGATLIDGSGEYHLDRLMVNNMAAMGGLDHLESVASGLFKFVRMSMDHNTHYSGLQYLRRSFDPDPFMADGYVIETIVSQGDKPERIILTSPFIGMRQSEVESPSRLDEVGQAFISFVNGQTDVIMDSANQFVDPKTGQLNPSVIKEVVGESMDELFDIAEERGMPFDEDDDTFVFIFSTTVTNIIRKELSNKSHLIFGSNK